MHEMCTETSSWYQGIFLEYSMYVTSIELVFSSKHISNDRLVSKVTSLWRYKELWFDSQWMKKISLLQCVKTRSRNHPATYPTNIWRPFHGG